MPGNFMRETPAEFEDRIKDDATVLWRLLYSLSGEEPEFLTELDRKAALQMAEDFIDRGADRVTPRQYVREIHQLARGAA